MASNAPLPSKSGAPEGLPPIKPPSGRFIAQMFMIPLLIVACLVIVFALGGLAWLGTSTPEAFLAKLQNPNPDIRWRAAHELGQVLQRPESLELASNPDFALDLAELLEKALATLEQAENTTKSELEVTFRAIQNDKNLNSDEKAAGQDKAALAAWRKLQPERNLVHYLTSCLGHFTIPVGVHALSVLAMKDKSAEIKGLSLRRRQAVWALGNLGGNMQQHYFGKNVGPNTKVLTGEQKEVILDKLAKAASGSGDRAKIAQYTLDVLTQKEPAKVDVVLDYCSKAEDVFLREEVAFALNFWDGDLVEPTLLRLARDDGHGKRIVVTEAD